MSYLVLARKWRPLQFKDVLGQQHVTTTLENAIKSGRIANAYLFSGPRGVGKTTIARILAKAINCENGPTITPCNQCSNCIEITESHSLDVFEIDGASNRGIDEVRNLRENLRYAPNKNRYKIYIIDEVHMLTVEAFNALLKTLEEPPKNVLFIFATTEPHKVPATISSRCQRFTFKRMSIKRIVEQLKKICEAEKISIDEESLLTIAKKADGSMRDAESVLDQAYSFCGNEIKYEQLIELLGIIDSDLLFELSDCIKTQDIQRVLTLANNIFMEGYDINEFLIHAAEHFRNILITRATQSVAQLDVSELLAQRYLKEAADFQEEDLLRYINLANETEYTIKRSSNPRLKFEFALAKMVKMDSSLKLSQLIDRIDGLQHNYNPFQMQGKMPATTYQPQIIKDQSTGRSQSRPQHLLLEDRKSEILASFSTAIPNELDKKSFSTEKPEEIKTVTVIDIETIKSNWELIIETIRKQKVALAAFINEGKPTSVENNILEITFRNDNGFHINSIMNNKILIEKIINKIIGTPLHIKCVKGELPVAKITATTQDSDKLDHAPVDKETNDTIIEEVIAAFDGEIIG